MVPTIEYASHLELYKRLFGMQRIQMLRLDDFFILLSKDFAQRELGHLTHFGFQTHRCDKGVHERLFLSNCVFWPATTRAHEQQKRSQRAKVYWSRQDFHEGGARFLR